MAFPLPDSRKVVQQQSDAVISQANPVSATWYTILDTTLLARLLSIAARITWATTQPTPLRIRLTIDGKLFIFSMTNPVSATWYACVQSPTEDSETAMSMVSTIPQNMTFLFEGKSLKIEAQITWATTQPTPLEARVKYAKY